MLDSVQNFSVDVSLTSDKRRANVRVRSNSEERARREGNRRSLDRARPGKSNLAMEEEMEEEHETTRVAGAAPFEWKTNHSEKFLVACRSVRRREKVPVYSV